MTETARTPAVIAGYTAFVDDAHRFVLDVTAVDRRARKAGASRRVMFEPSTLAFHEVPAERLRRAEPRTFDPVRLADRLGDRMDQWHRNGLSFNVDRCMEVWSGLGRVPVPARMTAAERAEAEAAARAAAEAAAEAAERDRRERERAAKLAAKSKAVAFVATAAGVKAATAVEPVHGEPGKLRATVGRKGLIVDASAVFETRAAAVEMVHRTAKPVTAKMRMLLDMMARPEGASGPEMMTALGWKLRRPNGAPARAHKQAAEAAGLTLEKFKRADGTGAFRTVRP